MEITDRHMKILMTSKMFEESGNQIFNKADAEECVDMGLVESAPGYPLTDKGQALLKK